MSFKIKDFPILKRKINGHRLVYLDSANTSLTPVPVVQAMDEYFLQYKSNIHRALYPTSEQATQRYEGARDKIQQFVGAKHREEIIFTKNATESINLVVNTWGRDHLRKGDMVVLSIAEHHSNIVPWQLLQKEKGFSIHYLDLDISGSITMAEYSNILKNEKVKCVAITHQSNVLGIINPVEKMIEMAHTKGAVVLIDGSQAAPHMVLDVAALNPDFYAFTGHKMMGPTGIGILYGRKKLLEEMPPFLGGGDMIRSVQTSGSTWNDLPHKFEAGTPNIAGVIGLGAAVQYLSTIGMREIERHDQQLLEYALEKMLAFPRLKVIGPKKTAHRGSLISFTMSGIHPHDMASMLGERGICVRAGNHCAQPLLEYYGLPASLRVSWYWYNTPRDIDAFLQGLREVQKKFK